MSEEINKDIEKFEARQVKIPVEKQETFLGAIERLASNPNVDVAKIEKIMDMQERILDRNAKQAFNAAMTKAQNKIELVVATRTNKQTHSLYAQLGDVLLKAKPIYTAEGFSLMFYEGETSQKNHKRICVDIMHEQGHTEKKYGDFAIQTTGIQGTAMMTEIHGEGSAFSYGRRYLTCSIFNIPTGDDDDGNKAGQGKVRYINETQIKQLKDERDLRKVDGKMFLAHFDIEALEQLPAKRFGEAMELMRAKPIPTKERQPGDEDDSTV